MYKEIFLQSINQWDQYRDFIHYKTFDAFPKHYKMIPQRHTSCNSKREYTEVLKIYKERGFTGQQRSLRRMIYK